jgi:hypothetical protein
LVRTSFEPDPELPTRADFPPGWSFLAVDGHPDVAGRWEPGTARDGERSLSISGSGPRGAFFGPRVAVSPGDWVRSSVWVRSWKLDGAAYLGIIWYDSEGQVIDEVRSGPGSGPERWRRCALEAPAPPGTVTLRPFLALEGAGMVWFDELRVIRRRKPPMELVELVAPAARQGERCPVRLSLRVLQPCNLAEFVALELVSAADGTVAAEAEFEIGLETDEELEPGVYALGPYDLEIDPYATPGPYHLKARLGTRTLDSFGMEHGTLTVERRSRTAREGRRARIQVEAPAAVQAGDLAHVSVSMTVWPPTDEPIFASVALEREGALYAAAELLLGIEAQTDTSTELGDATQVALPATLEDGDYEIVARPTGDVLDGAPGRLTVEVTGGHGGARPYSWGRYVSAEATSHYWRTTDSGVLVWDGLPFAPIGAMLRTRYLDEYSSLDPEGNGDRWRELQSRTRDLADAGIQDVYLVTGARGLAGVPTEAMQRVVDRLEELDLTYGIEIGGPLHAGFDGYLLGVDWHLDECVPGRENVISLPPTRYEYGPSALVTLYDEATGQLVGTRHAPLEHNAVTLRIEETEETAGRSYSLHVTPMVHVPSGMGSGDVASEAAFRARKLAVCGAIEELRFGDGLRFLTNPLSGDPGLPPASVIPAFPSTFARNFGLWLEGAYGGDLDALRDWWGVAGIPSFESAGRLVPASGPGAMPLVDVDTGQAFVFDPDSSGYWSDLEAYRQEMQADGLEDMVESIKSVVDVPVILEPVAGEMEARPSQGEASATFLRASRGTGLHNISLSPRFGHDGVSIAAPSLPHDLTAQTLAVRLAENRQQARHPWLMATRLTPSAEDLVEGRSLARTLDQAHAWGARAAYLRWGSDELDDPAAPDLIEHPGLLGALGRLVDSGRLLLPAADPGLVFVYPPRRRAMAAGITDGRSLALDGALASAPAQPLGDGRWLVPAAAFRPGTGDTYIVSLPVARRHPRAARVIERWATREAPVGTVWLLGPRHDHGRVPGLDDFLKDDAWAACAFGTGQYQLLKPVPDLEPSQQGDAGYPVLASVGRLRLFPVEGLSWEAAKWVLGGQRPDTPATPSGTHPDVDQWRIEVSDD